MAVQPLNLIREEKYVSKKLLLSSAGRHRPGEGQPAPMQELDVTQHWEQQWGGGKWAQGI